MKMLSSEVLTKKNRLLPKPKRKRDRQMTVTNQQPKTFKKQWRRISKEPVPREILVRRRTSRPISTVMVLMMLWQELSMKVQTVMRSTPKKVVKTTKKIKKSIKVRKRRSKTVTMRLRIPSRRRTKSRLKQSKVKERQKHQSSQ